MKVNHEIFYLEADKLKMNQTPNYFVHTITKSAGTLFTVQMDWLTVAQQNAFSQKVCQSIKRFRSQHLTHSPNCCFIAVAVVVVVHSPMYIVLHIYVCLFLHKSGMGMMGN